MKHFFDQSAELDAATKAELLKSAKASLKRSPMMLSEMSTKMSLICFNASGADHYFPKGMDSLISLKNIPIGKAVPDTIEKEISDIIDSSQSDVLGYILENIQTKEVHNYFEIIFKLKNNSLFDPVVIAHFSYTELIEYLKDFLKAAHVEGSSRKIEIFDEKNLNSWKTITSPRDLNSVDQTVKAPIVIDRPFFNDVHVIVQKNEQQQIMKSSFGQIKSIQQYFNKYQAPSGEFLRSKNKLFFQWKDLKQFKLASAQSKNMLGITYNGEYVASAQFVTHQIGIDFIEPSAVDCFHFLIAKEPIEIKPEQIAGFELNLDTQQMIIKRKVGENEYHASRFNRLRLHLNNQTANIDKVIPFNRGESNYDLIQKLVGTRYTECEKARSILTDRGELGLLSSRNITSGDLLSHLVLSNLKLFNYVTFKARCIGFEPKDVRNQEHFSTHVVELNKELSQIFKDILDVSETPSLTTHNINRLTKKINEYLKLKDRTKASYKMLEEIIKELENLIQYMDDFFKLNVYSKFEENLECDVIPDDESKMLENAAIDGENIMLDNDAKSFITENYTFFRKRGLVENALIKTERLLFYNKQIKPFAEDLKFEPDIIVYNNSKKRMDNYLFSAYPAMDLSKVLSKELVQFANEEEELAFVRFMRSFTEKTYQKALELNKSFHHQYKHTLAELGFITDEKLSQLNRELEFLEKPENREEAYKKLLERMKQLFMQHLEDKEKNIQELKKELQEVTDKKEKHQKILGERLNISIADDNLEEILNSMPERLEKHKNLILKSHKIKLDETSVVLNAYAKLHAAANKYFSKVLGSFNEFLKALWIRRYQQMFDKIKIQSMKLCNLPPEEVQNRIDKLKERQYDKEKEIAIQKEMTAISQEMKSMLIDLRAIPLKGLFKQKLKKSENLWSFLEYYKSETEKLVSLVRSIQPVYKKLSILQNQLFKKQEEYVAEKLDQSKNELQLQLAEKVLANPQNKEELENFEQPSDKVPTEIKDELSALRAELVAIASSFKESISIQLLEKVTDYTELYNRSRQRDEINDISKELVNFRQGIKGIQSEIEGEQKDLEFLKTQEDNLEEIAMSKALPSTRILLKTQYIPMITKEKKLLDRANHFLTEIISKQDAVMKALVLTFFKKRYGLPQFAKGSYCLDTSAGTKDHTERNIYSAYGLFSERFSKSWAEAVALVDSIRFSKIEVNGIDSLKNRISQIWHGHLDDRFLCLPSSLSMEEALELCDYKATIVKNNPKSLKSQNSLILIYTHKFDYDRITSNKTLLQSYNQAVLSNIFINIDGVKIFNNRDSIFDACVRETFGNCDDQWSANIFQKLLYES